MPLPPSGPISMSMINIELALPATQVISLNDANVRALAQVPAGVISLSNFYGKANIERAGYVLGGWAGLPNTAPVNTIYQFNFPSETGLIISATTPNGTRMLPSFGSTSTDGYAPRRGAPPGATAANFSDRFNFTSKTFSSVTLAAVPSSNPGGTDGFCTQFQTESVSYCFAGRPGGATARYLRKFTMPTQTINFYEQVVQTTTGPQAAVILGTAVWPAAKNYGKGFSLGGQRPTPPGSTAALNTRFTLNIPTEVTTVNAADTSFFTSQLNTMPGYNGVGLGQSSENGFMYTQFTPPVPFPMGTLIGINTNIGRLNFSTETATRLFQNVGVSRWVVSPFSTPTEIYWLGGAPQAAVNDFNPPPAGYAPAISEIVRYPFATSTLTIVPTASIPARKGGNAVVQSVPVLG